MKNGTRPRQGMILFIVTLVLAILVIGGLSLMYLMRAERDTTSFRTQELQLTDAVRSGVVLMQEMSGMVPAERAKYGGLYNNTQSFQAVPILTEAEGARDDVRFTILVPLFENEAPEGIRYGLTNESTRLNLQAVLDWDREKPGTGRRALMKLPGMTSSQADSILDWLDPDETPRPHGAEAQWYSSHALPYSPRNALPVFLEELLLVRNVSRSRLYGSDESFNYDGIAEKKNIASGESKIPWSLLLTVFSAERDVDLQGRPRINLNEKNLDFLYRELTRFVGKPAADFVIRYRQFGPAKAGALKQANTSARPPARPDLKVPPKFEFRTPLDLMGAAVLLPDKSLVQSPYSDAREITPAFLKFLDSVSTAPSPVITGRININEAPLPVLRAIPGLSSVEVQKIVSSRPPIGKPVTDVYRHSIWLYSEGIVSLPVMKDLWTKITTGGDVFRGQIVGFIEGRGANVRAEVVVDGTVVPARQVFYKDLSMFGEGFSQNVLKEKMKSESGFAGSLMTGDSLDSADSMGTNGQSVLGSGNRNGPSDSTFGGSLGTGPSPTGNDINDFQNSGTPFVPAPGF